MYLETVRTVCCHGVHCQLRPVFDADIIGSIPVELSDDCDWGAVVNQALKHKRLRDSHFFKVCCAPRESEETHEKRDDLSLEGCSQVSH